MSPAVLDLVLSKLPRPNDPNLLVGISTKDDAGVYRLSDDLALVQTTDFFTPIVDDPFAYGQIAAANSLSDVYAMGGRPLTALSLVCFPQDGDMNVLERILAGGLNKMAEAGCTVVGGHTVRDQEIKFGYAVTGTIHPDRIWTNQGARPGDRLLLTKPLGTGVITTALRKGQARDSWVEAAVAAMSSLNRAAAEALQPFSASIHAVTDVTGFGLLGHAFEMATGSGVSLRLDSSQMEWVEGALDCARAGHLAGGLKNNREFVGDCAAFEASVPPEVQHLLYDPQTSGGLLVAIAPD
ncbi:MAG: selenide, water dikinase SelD, partial [Acidobacteria bacterium]|nr:selenide, water dikinase SelD [Acidobacteriota bacterium]